MFDYLLAQQSLPHTQCPTCHNTITFHGDHYPIQMVCANCGQFIDLTDALKKLTYPNMKLDKDGKLIVEKTVGEKDV